jgi:hypothetical protein
VLRDISYAIIHPGGAKMKIKYIHENLGYLDNYSSLEDAILQLEKAKAKADEGGWKNVSVCAETEESYGDTNVFMVISGYRPETKVERDIRILAEKYGKISAEKALKDRELKEYERLKAKFEKKP